MTFVLTLEAVKTAAREAFAKGELGFQKGEENCLYRGASGAPCAVGAALPPEVIDRIVAHGRNETPVTSILLKDYFFVEENEADAIADIQAAHDAIINAARDRASYSKSYDPKYVKYVAGIPPEEALVATFKSLIGAE